MQTETALHTETRSAQIRFEAILERIPQKTDRLLDVGCVRHSEDHRQDANLHATLNEWVQGDVIGVDIEEDEIETMRAEGWDVRVADAEMMQFDEPFDAIVAGELLEHLANPGLFLSRARDALRPDGRIVLSTPNPDGFVWWRKALADQSNNEEHTCWVDPAQLDELVSRVSDIQIEECRYLPPSGGLSSVLWRAGVKRGASPTYVAVLERRDADVN